MEIIKTTRKRKPPEEDEENVEENNEMEEAKQEEEEETIVMLNYKNDVRRSEFLKISPHHHHHHHQHHHHHHHNQQQQYNSSNSNNNNNYDNNNNNYSYHQYRRHRYLSSSSQNQSKNYFEFKEKFHLDQNRVLYLSLLWLIFSCVFIRVATASSASTVIPLIMMTPSLTMQTEILNNISSTNDINNFTKNSLKLKISSDNSMKMMMKMMISTDDNANDDEISVTTEKVTLLISSNADDVATIAADAIETHRRTVRDASNVPDDNDDDDSSYRDEELDEYDALINNKSAKGKYIGAPCDDFKCEPTLIHVSCDKDTKLCACEKNYPVVIGLTRGCDKPKKLGEQCFYDETCLYNDENSLCVQVKHNAMCQCATGFHSVTYSKPTRRVFCTQDIAELTSDLPTLLGVSTGIAVLGGLICMVLHLISKTKYPRHRNFGDANLPPPIMYSSDTGIPLTVQSGRPSSRSSVRSSGSIGSYGNRRSSSTIQSGAVGHTSAAAAAAAAAAAGSKGSRRPSLASVHSTSSSVRSYSMMRFEKETQQREIRQEMKLRLARLQQQQHMSQNKPQIVIGDASTTVHQSHGTTIARVSVPTPSPLTPNSMDELLPAVDETQEFPIKSEQPSTSATAAATATTTATVARSE